MFSDDAHYDISAQPNRQPLQPTLRTKPDGMTNKKGKWTSWHTIPHDIQDVWLDFVDSILTVYVQIICQGNIIYVNMKLMILHA